MLRDRPHLCKYMPKPKDARRLIPDPTNEPDFYAISEKYPLSDVKAESARKRSTDESFAAPPAGSPRLSSSSLAVGKALMPPAKRARVAAPEGSCPPTLGGAATNLLFAKLVTPNTGASSRNVATVNAASLLVATNALLTSPGSAPVPTLPMSPLMSSLASNDSSRQQGGNNTWARLRTPQMQTAVDRNAAVLSALRAAMTSQAANRAPQLPPPTTADPAATLASLLRQVSNNNNPAPGGAGGGNQLANWSNLLNGRF